MLDKEELLFDELYEKTKDCGRTQFIKLLMERDRKIKELKEKLDEYEKLKKQLDYIRSGEYYNQLRFERDMLQNVIDNGEVSKEDKEFIDMTHRNTELLEENEKLKKQLEEYKTENKTLTKDKLEYLTEYGTMLSSQEEFIKYLEDCITELDKGSMNKIENAINLGIVDITKTILQKYKKIIGAESGNNR